MVLFVFFCKQKTDYEMRISDWSSDVCSSDLRHCQAEALRRPSRRHPSQVAEELQRGRRTEVVPAQRPISQEQSQVPQVVAVSAHRVRAVPRVNRSEERRVGKECVRTVRSRWAASNITNKNKSKPAQQI